MRAYNEAESRREAATLPNVDFRRRTAKKDRRVPLANGTQAFSLRGRRAFQPADSFPHKKSNPAMYPEPIFEAARGSGRL